MITAAPLQSSIDLGSSSEPVGQFAIAASVLVVIYGIIIALRYRARFSGLSETDARHRSALTGSKRDQTPRSLYVPLDRDPLDAREDLRRLFDRGSRYVDDRATFLEAAGSMRTSVRASLHPVTSRVSGYVLQLVSLAWLVAVFGALAVSTEAVIYYLGGTLTVDDFGRVVDELVTITSDVLVAGESFITGFPYGATVWDVTFALTTLAWEWAYMHWPVVSAALLSIAVVIAWLEWRLEDSPDTRLYTSWLRLYSLTIGSITLVWLVGVVPASIGTLAGLPGPGQLVGFLAAAATAIFVGFLAARGFVRRLQQRAREAADATPLVRAYLVVRRGGLLAAIPSSVLVVAYAVVLVATGKLGRIVDAVLTADASVQLAIVAVVVAMVAASAYLLRESWPDVQQSVRDNWSRVRFRTALLRRGVPLVGVFGGLLVATSFTDNVVIGTLLGVTGGIVAYYLWGLVERAKYRLDLRPSSRRRPKDVLVQGYVLEDDDGGTHPMAVINGRVEIARASIDDVVDETVDAIAAVQTGEAYGPTVGTWHARNVLELGVITEEETRAAARERARKTIMDELRPVGRPRDRDDVERVAERIPESIWTDVYDDLLDEVFVEREDSVELLSDPWGEGRRERRRSALSSFFF